MATDLFDRIIKDKGPLGKWADKAEGYYVFPKLEGPISNRMSFNGKKVVTWSINDYLGLANHPEVLKVDGEAATLHGMAYPMGARMMSGHTNFHEQLERECAEFVEKEAAYLVNFGYQGMVSAIDALVTKHDVIVYDMDTHACIIDGVRLHAGKRFVYKHNDIESFEKNLKRATKMAEVTGGGILVISEGVFGMRGEQGRLKEIVALKEQYNFRLLEKEVERLDLSKEFKMELIFILPLLLNLWQELELFLLEVKKSSNICNIICVLKCLQNLYQWQWLKVR
jgi:glycine C-acetyltransferase